MLMYQKIMFDHFYCIKSFCGLKTLRKYFENSIFFNFLEPIMEGKSMKDVLVLKMPVSKQRRTSSSHH